MIQKTVATKKNCETKSEWERLVDAIRQITLSPVDQALDKALSVLAGAFYYYHYGSPMSKIRNKYEYDESLYRYMHIAHRHIKEVFYSDDPDPLEVAIRLLGELGNTEKKALDRLLDKATSTEQLRLIILTNSVTNSLEFLGAFISIALCEAARIRRLSSELDRAANTENHHKEKAVAVAA